MDTSTAGYLFPIEHRAHQSIALRLSVALVIFAIAWVHLTVSASNPAALEGTESNVRLYFKVTVFSTVGFGDITPKSDMARIVAMVQMLADLAVIAVVVRMILGAATRGVARLQGSNDEAINAPP